MKSGAYTHNTLITGFVKSIFRVCGKLVTDHMLLEPPDLIFTSQEGVISLLISGPYRGHEALPLSGQISRGHGWSKYLPHLFFLWNLYAFIYTCLSICMYACACICVHMCISSGMMHYQLC